MGTFSCPIEVFSNDGSRTATIAAAVDTGSTYTCLPAGLLRDLGATPSRRIQFELADGNVIEDEIGEVRVRLQGIELNTIVVFAAADLPPKLGAYTLTGALLVVDPVKQQLVPGIALRISRREAMAA